MSCPDFGASAQDATITRVTRDRDDEGGARDVRQRRDAGAETLLGRTLTEIVP